MLIVYKVTELSVWQILLILKFMRQSKIRQSSNSKFLGEQVGNWKEVVFKIRLTENEYKLLLQEKSKDVLKI